MGKLTGLAIGLVRSGKLGGGPQAAWQLLEGKKSLLALGAGALTALLVWAESQGLCAGGYAEKCALAKQVLGGLTLVLGFLGQVDGALRMPAPPEQ